MDEIMDFIEETNKNNNIILSSQFENIKFCYYCNKEIDVNRCDIQKYVDNKEIWQCEKCLEIEGETCLRYYFCHNCKKYLYKSDLRYICTKCPEEINLLCTQCHNLHEIIISSKH